MTNKNALIIASVASMIDQFIMPSIELLISLGYNVDVATNFVKGSTCSDEKIQSLLKRLDNMTVDTYHIDFDRKVIDLRSDLRALKQVGAVARGSAEPVNKNRHHSINEGNKYGFIHSHSPIGGVIGRIIGRKYKIKNIYTAHGFHFYDGAPVVNWIVFYPIEKNLSRITDVLITINLEDYQRANSTFKAKQTVYIPGIGVDIAKYQHANIDRANKRLTLGLNENDTMLLSVGELNDNKNHRIVIEALGRLDDAKRGHIHYFIAGKDAGQLDTLRNLARDLNINLHLLGFRTDVSELLKASDVFILPSIREGLNVSLMEAMASGVPCIASNIRGNKDLIDDKDLLFNPSSAESVLNSLTALKNGELSLICAKNMDNIKKFGINEVNQKLKDLYISVDKIG